MKRSMFVLATVLVTILVGCQENNLSGPPATDVFAIRPAPKTAPGNNRNIIILETTVVDANNVQYSVTGQVKYGLRQLPIMSEELFDVALDTQAKVKQLSSKEIGWTVSVNSSDRVNLTVQASATVDKWYFLQGGPNSLYLHLQFDVTATNVSLASITIE